MPKRSVRRLAAESISQAMAELSDALEVLEHMPDDDSLVGFVAHAMENYLSVSEAALGLVERAIGDHPNPELSRWIDGLRHLGGLMRHTVGRLLRIPPAGEFPLRPGSVDLPLLMERACDYHRPSAARKQLKIVCRAVGEVPPVWADRVAIAIAANNLLSNAIKVSRPHGDIVVQIMPGPGGVVCSVRDHGPVLTFSEHARLFAYADAPGSMPEPSQGPGLAIAKELVQRMHGRLWAENHPDYGVCFAFRLPYQSG